MEHCDRIWISRPITVRSVACGQVEVHTDRAGCGMARLMAAVDALLRALRELAWNAVRQGSEGQTNGLSA